MSGRNTKDTKDTKIKHLQEANFLWSICLGVLSVLCVLGSASTAIAQPDPRQMAGIPRPDPAQPPQSVSVRLIRGQMTNNIVGHPVDLLVNGKPQTEKTDSQGRAQFFNLPAGATVRAVTTVDSERLESQEFPAPGAGQPGIRLILVATDKGEAGAAPPAVTGELRLGGETRIVIEPDDDVVRVFYLLDIVNPASSPVNPTTNFMFDTPIEAQSTTIMEGSSPNATATGTRVRVQGPFEPGETFVQVGYILPVPAGVAAVQQTFPAPLERLAVMVKKAGDARLTSPNLDRQQDMPAGGEMYIVGVGDRATAAGTPVSLLVTGLPHHSTTPRWIALGLALTIAVVGFVAAWRPAETQDRGNERKQLIARRERLFQDLLRLEADQRRGKGDGARYAARREALLAELEHVYGELDTDDTSPEPASRAGLAA